MSITYEQIRKASNEIVTTNIKGKDYAPVNGRVDAFRKLFPTGFITTEIISMADGLVVMKATCGYYDDNGQPVILGTGHAYEREGSSQINRTRNAILQQEEMPVRLPATRTKGQEKESKKPIRFMR